MFVVVDFASVGSEEKTSLSCFWHGAFWMLRFATGVGATFSWILLGFSRWVPECPKQQFLNRPGGFIVHMVQGATMVVCNEGSGYNLSKKLKSCQLG